MGGNLSSLGGLMPEGLDPSLLLKAGKALSGMNDPDERCILLGALKPYLGSERRKRADEAVQMLKMLKIAELFRKDLF